MRDGFKMGNGIHPFAMEKCQDKSGRFLQSIDAGNQTGTILYRFIKNTHMNKLLIGFAAGAILGILYAPAKGCDTREKLSNVGNDLKEGWNSITDRIAGSIDRMREGVDDIANKAVEKVESTQFETATV